MLYMNSRFKTELVFRICAKPCFARKLLAMRRQLITTFLYFAVVKNRHRTGPKTFITGATLLATEQCWSLYLAEIDFAPHSPMWHIPPLFFAPKTLWSVAATPISNELVEGWVFFLTCITWLLCVVNPHTYWQSWLVNGGGERKKIYTDLESKAWAKLQTNTRRTASRPCHPCVPRAAWAPGANWAACGKR